LAGLSATPKRIPAKYFYDEHGSALFEQICALPEYYPTRVETQLLRQHGQEMADFIGRDVTLVEFGAGALRKVEVLLGALEGPRAYVPIDISGEFLRTMAAKLRRSQPALAIHPVVADFTKALALPVIGDGERRAGFFPGSTIGNLERGDALGFLCHAKSLLRGGGLLVGVDLVKDPEILHAAYNDSAGVTAAFNRNILERANRELEADFDVDGFAHYAFYNPGARRVEMHLLSRERQTVYVLGRDIAFEEGETIHTENSHKYTVEEFQRLATVAGFTAARVWSDKDRLFSLHWLEAVD
jgi:dimethylhistidine N-methyltransferase